MGRYANVRVAMAARRYDAFLLPRSDAYLNEDLAPADEALHISVEQARRYYPEQMSSA